MDPGKHANLTPGIHLIESERFPEARDWFARQRLLTPQEPDINFYLGRTYLAMAQPRAALEYFNQAVYAQADRAEYHFWWGLCHWALGSPSEELVGYERALKLNPAYLPAHVYAGHNYMDRQQWRAALVHYRRVLETVPDHAQALFNSGIALHHLDQKDKAQAAWRRLLSFYSTGQLALAAVHRLNDSGDFSYRTHRVGSVRVIVKPPNFKAGQCRLAHDDVSAVKSLGEQMLNHSGDWVLHVVGYVDGDKQLARCRVRSIKTYLMNQFPIFTSNQIRLSWFEVPETIRHGGNTWQLKESIQFFTIPANYNSI